MTVLLTRTGVAAALASLLCTALPTAAQERAPAAPGAAAAPRANPGDARAQVPGVTYRSAFQGYRQHADAEVGPWVEANDKVGRIGGWRVYAQEAAAPAAAASAAPASAPVRDAAPAKPTTSGHHGHKH